MIASMTAFARVETEQSWGSAIWELRSVNHRFLDLSFKIPENCRRWELNWRTLVSKMLARGKIECHLTFFPSQQMAPRLRINKNLVEQLLINCQTLMEHPAVKPTVQSMDLLNWPEVVFNDPPDMAQLQESFSELLQTALEELVKTRAREGADLKQGLKARLGAVLQQVQQIKEVLPECRLQQKQKLIQKLHDIQEVIDQPRLEQELVFYAQRIDIEEEIERLITHVKEVHRVLDNGGACGRRLDFLMQEMNREANTLGAKASDSRIVQAAIELKVLIEQMREQVQNVE